jgi:hypothetical protein
MVSSDDEAVSKRRENESSARRRNGGRGYHQVPCEVSRKISTFRASFGEIPHAPAGAASSYAGSGRRL